LSTVGGGHDAGGAVDVEADVLRWIERRLAGVDAYADPDRALGEAAHCFADGADGGLGRGEGVEERVAFVVDLVALVSGARIAHDAAVLDEGVAVPVGAELLEQPRRALDVGEHQRHRPRRLWDLGHAPIVVSPRRHSHR
jgi:hypothetical protein